MDADIAEAAKRVGQALEGAGVEYAIRGALALGIHGALRATRDVDVNVFRTKDLADLEQLVRTTPLDRLWIKETISSMMGADDPRVGAWERITA